jgi:hypothetical protein
MAIGLSCGLCASSLNLATEPAEWASRKLPTGNIGGSRRVSTLER